MAIQFSPELRERVLAGQITVTVRLWSRNQAREGGRYAVGDGLIEIDSIEELPFSAIDDMDVRRAGSRPRGVAPARSSCWSHHRRHDGAADRVPRCRPVLTVFAAGFDRAPFEVAAL